MPSPNFDNLNLSIENPHLTSGSMDNQAPLELLKKKIEEIKEAQNTNSPLELDILELPIVNSFLLSEKTGSKEILKFIKEFDQSVWNILIKALTFGNIQDLLFNETAADKELLQLLIKNHNIYLESKIDTWLMMDQIFSKNLLEAVLASNWEQDEQYLSSYLPFIRNIPEEEAEKILKNPSQHKIFMQLAGNFINLPPDTSEILGFDLAKLVTAWRMINYDKKEYSLATFEHGKATFELEKEHPGSVKFLMKNYGICDFNRYPPEILLRQIDLHKEKVPYGAYFFARADHNNALGKDQAILMGITANLPKINLKILEVDNLQDLAKKLVFLSTKFGPMNYLIIAGHGDGQSIQLGIEPRSLENKSRSYRLNNEDIENINDDPNIQERFLKPKAPIFINSCSAGVKDGIAQKIAEKLNTLVMGPDAKNKLIFLEALFNDGEIAFFPSYTNPENKNVSCVYYNGKKGSFSI
jgi:hypothetical protein